jgi:hypothetical protein
MIFRMDRISKGTSSQEIMDTSETETGKNYDTYTKIDRRNAQQRLRRAAWKACLKNTLRTWNRPVQRVTGSALHGETTSALIFGQVESHLALLKYLFPNAFQIEPLGCRRLDIILRNGGELPEAELTLCAVNPWTYRLFAPRGWKIGLRWIECCRNIPESMEALESSFSRTLRSELRTARTAGFTIQRSQNTADMEAFYRCMYVPTIQKRHAETAFITPLDEFKVQGACGILLKVMHGAEWVAGAMVLPYPDELCCAVLGWLEGEETYLRQKVVTLLYQGAIAYAREQGFAKINFGAVRGFADDGVLAYKAKWRLRPEVRRFQYRGNTLWGPLNDFYALKFSASSPAIQALLHQHPIFIRRKAGLEVLTWNLPLPALLAYLKDELIWNDLSTEVSSDLKRCAGF